MIGYNLQRLINFWFVLDSQLGCCGQKFEFDELKGVIEYYPQSYHATDREGWPVYIEKPGKVDRKKMMQVTSVDVHVVYTNDRAPKF